jgi:HlyD family secretion protein
VLRVAPRAKVEQNVTLFEVTCLVENSDGLLKAGMNAEVEVVMARALDVLILPVRAVRAEPLGEARAESEGVGTAVHDSLPSKAGTPPAAGRGGHPRRGDGSRWVRVRSGGNFEWRSVAVGLANLDDVEITSGVAEGDTVVYELVSGAMQAREEFRDRMRSRGPVGDMRRGGS